ncbi:MAG: DnaJ C-terminal domain-containing protein [Pseudomonadota bacterium]
MQFKDYYEVLGVPPGADADVVKSAYRRQARKFHPDVSKEKDAEERFKAVNEAYEVLKDPKKRAAYDQLRARGYRPGDEFRPPPNFGQDFDVDLGGADAGGFSDFFESLFGRMRGGPAAAGGRRTRADSRARLDIDLERAYAGGVERVAVGGRTLDVKIPAGVQPGQSVRLAGQGSGGGDLLLEIGYRAHPRFRVDGRDITVVVPITPWEAALGASIPVPTLGGEVELRVPAGSASGKRLRLKGRGLPGATAGDQYVELAVQVPPATDDRATAFYEDMAKRFKGFDPRR